MILITFVITFSFLLGARYLYALYYLPRVRKILRATENLPTEIDSKFKFYIFVPLLNESVIFPKLVKRLENAFGMDKETTLIFITTERESVNTDSNESNTISLVQKYVETKNGEGVRHLHFPRINKSVAEQINFAVAKVQDEIALGLRNSYFGFYNADSHISPYTLPVLKVEIAKHSDAFVFQQSSAFLSNDFKGIKGLILRANALRQTRWTFLYEIPRYIRSWPRAINLTHVVTHGLFVRADVLKEVGNFPEDSYGEDLYLGYILHSFGFKVRALPILENSESPSTIWAMMKQKFVWFWGPLGYFFYWLRIKKRFPLVWKQNRLVMIGTAALGMVDALNWLFAGPAFVLYIIAAFSISSDVGLVCLFATLIYFGGTCAYALHIYGDRKNETIFPKMSLIHKVLAIVFYPFIVLIHGIPPLITIYKDIELRITGSLYLRPKTERV